MCEMQCIISNSSEMHTFHCISTCISPEMCEMRAFQLKCVKERSLLAMVILWFIDL